MTTDQLFWRSTNAGKVAAREPTFNITTFDRLVQLAISEDQAWHDYFQEYEIRPCVITYEDHGTLPEDVIDMCHKARLLVEDVVRTLVLVAEARS